MLIGAMPPLMLKTAANKRGLSIEVFDQLHAGVEAGRSQFFKDLSMPSTATTGRAPRFRKARASRSGCSCKG